MAKTTACKPKTKAAASGLAAETTSATIKTPVVIHAANRGPRTSTPAGWVLLLLDTVLLLDMPVAVKGLLLKKDEVETCHGKIPGQLRVLRESARLLSSYSNNNSPRCGTDQLRDAG
jgi:hypothetical protein